MLRAALIQPGRQDKALDTIERNASALTLIVEDVLDVSRIVSGKVRLDVQTVDLPQVVEHAVESIMLAANAKQIRVRTVIDPRAAPVSGDPGRLQQIMWNLLSNAVKFTPRGGQVQVRAERVNSHVELVVSDTGIGIDPAFVPHLLNGFARRTPARPASAAASVSGWRSPAIWSKCTAAPFTLPARAATQVRRLRFACRS
jgi:signal transduction histidine kinase